MAALRRMHVSRKPFQLTAPTSPEHQAQIDCTTMLQRVLRPEVCWTAIDHAHSFDMRPSKHGVPIGLIEAQKRKARGVRAGIPDYLFWAAGQGYGIEFKTGDGTLSDDQRSFLRELIAAKVEVAVCWGVGAGVPQGPGVGSGQAVREDGRMSTDRALAVFSRFAVDLHDKMRPLHDRADDLPLTVRIEFSNLQEVLDLLRHKLHEATLDRVVTPPKAYHARGSE